MNQPAPCYFCGKVMEPRQGIDHLMCSNHEEGRIWVIHHYNKFTLELNKIYWTMWRGTDRYGFSLRLAPQTTTICFIPGIESVLMKDILRFDCIPDNLIPETSLERLSFYLTYM
jgi:hypothetical protein